MSLKVAIQMDPLGSINPRTDTTLLMGLEAQRRGHALWIYTPDRLSWHDGSIIARAHRVTLHEDPNHHYDMGEEVRLDLRRLDVVLLRQDPPFHMGYLSTTYMLEQIHPRPLVVNHPAAVRNFPEKWFPTHFKSYMPPTLISADTMEISSFRKTHGDIVIKPLYGYGGHGVVHVRPHDDNLDALLEMQLARANEPLVAQKFLPEVKNQDRRAILIDGELAAMFARIPASGEIRANLRVGATAEKAEPTPRQREISEALKPILKKEGLVLAGVDFIGDWLTEINLTSPTGFATANALYGNRIESRFWDAMEAKL